MLYNLDMNRFKKLAYSVLLFSLLLMLFSCYLERKATADDNKNIKRIMKDGDFLYRNFFSKADVEKSEDSKDYIYTIKLRAEKDYDYNTVVAKFSKKQTTFYRDVEYDLSLSQSKGTLEYGREFITDSEIESYIDGDIINKLLSSTEHVDKVVLNGERLDADSVTTDLL